MGKKQPTSSLDSTADHAAGVVAAGATADRQVMQIESVSIDSLSLDPANARLHSPRNLEAIKSSLARFGQQKPIVVDANNVVRAGNGTLAAAKALGWKEIKIVRTKLANSEATAYAIADNRTGELAEWDEDLLADLLREDSIGDVGFDADEISDLLGEPDEVDHDPLAKALSGNQAGRLVKVLVCVDDLAAIEEAILLVGIATGNRGTANRGAALAQICREYAQQKG
jgi:hypothetical protein